MGEGKEGDPPPFPFLTVIFVCVGMLAHSIVFTAPLPYVAFMIVDFHMSKDLDDAGYAAGWITGMFMVGRCLAGIPWGLAADRWGRKICLFISMFNVMVFGILFGFSTNFYMAVTIRFLIGLGNGFMGIAKTYISEIVKCRDHEIRAFGYLNGTWGLGMIVGPAIGGALARPAIQYPSIFSERSIWGQYPYLLPSVVCTFFAAVAALGVLFFVPETLKPKDTRVVEKMPYLTVTQMDQLDDKSLHNTIEMVSTHGNEIIEEQELEAEEGSSSLSPDKDNNTTDDGDELTEIKFGKDIENQLHSNTKRIQKFIPIITKGNDEEKEKPKYKCRKALPSTLSEILSDKHVQNVFIIYMSYCGICMFFDESFPLYAVTSIANGGLAWESIEVGETLASVGFGCVVFQLFFFEPCMKRFFNKGNNDSLVRTMFLVSCVMPFLPLLADWTLRIVLASNPDTNTRTNVPLHVVVVLVLLLYRLPSMATFTSITMIVNSSVDSSMRGTVNGLMMTAGKSFHLVCMVSLLTTIE